MDKEFEKWAEEYKRNWKDSKAYSTIASSEHNLPLNHYLFPIYMQHKSSQKLINWTMWLVIGTWILAIGTILLAWFH